MISWSSSAHLKTKMTEEARNWKRWTGKMENRKSYKRSTSTCFTLAHESTFRKECDSGQDKLAQPRNFDTRKEINPRTLPAWSFLHGIQNEGKSVPFGCLGHNTLHAPRAIWLPNRRGRSKSHLFISVLYMLRQVSLHDVILSTRHTDSRDIQY